MKHGSDIYTVHALLKFSWSDTCWERGIWRADIFWFAERCRPILMARLHWQQSVAGDIMSLCRHRLRRQCGVVGDKLSPTTNCRPANILSAVWTSHKYVISLVRPSVLHSHMHRVPNLCRRQTTTKSVQTKHPYGKDKMQYYTAAD